MPKSFWTILVCAWIAAVGPALLFPASSTALRGPIAVPGSSSPLGTILLLPLLAITAAAGMRISGSTGFPGGWGAIAVAVSLPFVSMGVREPGAAAPAAAILFSIILLADERSGTRNIVLAGLLLAASSLRSPQLLSLLPFFFAVLALSHRLRHAILLALSSGAGAAAAAWLRPAEMNLMAWAGDGFAAWSDWSRLIHASPALLALAGYSPLILLALVGAPPDRPSGPRTPVILLAGVVALSLVPLPASAYTDSAPLFYVIAYTSIAALACRGARTLDIIVSAQGNPYWKAVVAALLVAPGLVTSSWY